MDPETANHLYEIGGKLLFLNAPANLEFGIDYNAWTIGPLFKGVKMIPPGLHFIYFSATSKEGVQGIRTGFFRYFETSEVVVREWNPKVEDLYDESEMDPAQTERYIINIREFERNMGPYPLDPPTYYQQWEHLTNYITPGLLKRVLPNNGRVSHLPAATTTTNKSKENGKGKEKMKMEDQHILKQQEINEEDTTTMANTTEPDMITIKQKRKGKEITEKEEGMEFTPFDIRQSFPPGATGDQITKWSLDKSWLTNHLLKQVYRQDHRLLLGEMQLAFVCLLMAQNFSGFQQWKQFVHLLCSCQELISEKPDLYLDFIDTLKYQLEECPTDFFHDILSENNFISFMLQNLQENIPSSNKKLYDKFNSLKIFLKKRFQWELSEKKSDDEEEDGEDAPVIVELDGSY